MGGVGVGEGRAILEGGETDTATTASRHVGSSSFEKDPRIIESLL